MSEIKKLTFIANPNAGKCKAKKIVEKIVPILETNGVECDVFFAETAKEARLIAAQNEASGEKNIIVVGGDGTFGEVVTGVENPSELNFGFIPSGTGNDFAKAAGLPRNIEECASVILKGQTKKIDYLQGYSRRAINVASTGFDTEVIKAFNRYKRRNKKNYYRALFKTLFRVKHAKYYVEIDGQKSSEEKQCFIFAACNGSYIGGGMKISPYSKIDDGMINFVCINSMPRRKILFRLFGFLKGKHIDKSYTVQCLCEEVKLGEGMPVSICYDGELLEEPFDVKIVKDGLNVFWRDSVRAEN